MSKTYLIHKTEHEGGLTVNERGLITTPPEDRPEWADGLGIAGIAEHVNYYRARTGDNYEAPQLINSDDLHWMGVTDDGDLTEIEPNAEFRMERLGLLLGIDLTDVEAFDKVTAGSLAEAAIAMDTERTPEEMAAFEESQKAGFAPLKHANG